MLRSLNGTFDLMQLLPVGIRISQHVEELSNENCRIAEPEPWHVAKLLGLFLSAIMHFILANSILIETFFLSFFFFNSKTISNTCYIFYSEAWKGGKDQQTRVVIASNLPIPKNKQTKKPSPILLSPNRFT